MQRRASRAHLRYSLTADLSRTRELLGWSLPASVLDGLRCTVDWYLARRGGV